MKICGDKIPPQRAEMEKAASINTLVRTFPCCWPTWDSISRHCSQQCHPSLRGPSPCPLVLAPLRASEVRLMQRIAERCSPENTACTLLCSHTPSLTSGCQKHTWAVAPPTHKCCRGWISEHFNWTQWSKESVMEASDYESLLYTFHQGSFIQFKRNAQKEIEIFLFIFLYSYPVALYVWMQMSSDRDLKPLSLGP